MATKRGPVKVAKKIPVKKVIEKVAKNDEPINIEANKQQNLLADKIKILNKLLQTKTKLYREKNSKIEDTVLIKILDELIELKYVFTEKQVNLFFELATYTPGYYGGFICSTIGVNNKINEYMLTNYNINEIQLTNIMSMRQYNNELNYCYDILFKNKYDFTIGHFGKLRNLKYFPKLMVSYDTIHNNMVFSACLYLAYKSAIAPNKDIMQILQQNFNKCIDLLKQNKLGFNIEHLNIISAILQKQTGLDVLLDSLFLNCNDSIFKLIVDSDYSHSDEVLCKILDNFGYDNNFVKYLFENSIPYNPEILLKLVIKGYNVTLSDLNNLLISSNLIYFRIMHIDNYEKLSLNKQYANLDSTVQIPLIDIFEIFKIEPDINTLNIACKRDNENEVKLLLDKYKLIPDINTLNECITKLNYNIIHTILSYKITPSNDILFKITSYQLKYSSKTHDIANIIELLIKFGLVVKIDSIEYLLSNKFHLENLERFDIKYDEYLYFLCYLGNYWPNEYMSKFTINKSVLELHNLCRNNRLGYDDLIVFMQKNNVLLDRFAIDNLLNDNRGLYETIFIKFECIPSVLTAYKRCAIPLDLIVKEHNITANDMFKQYKMDI